MIDYDQFCRIKRFREQGLKAGQIAVELGLDSRTVGKWMNQERFQLRLPGLRASKLDPYKNDIVRMLERHPYSAQQVFQQITEQGYVGGYTTVKEYVRKVRPRPRKAFLKLVFAPGECASGGLGLIPIGGGWQYPAKAELFCHGPLSLPDDVCGVHCFPDHGAFSWLPPEGIRVLRRCSAKGHGR